MRSFWILTGVTLGALLLAIQAEAQAQITTPLMVDAEPAWLLWHQGGSGSSDRSEDGFAEHLETDRDSFTPATTTVHRGRLLFESAYSYIEGRQAADTHSFPEIVTRYGLTDRIELRLGWNFELGGGGSISSGDGGTGIEEPGDTSEAESQLQYGIKMAVTDQVDCWPASAVIIQGISPTSGPDPDSDVLLAYVFGWEFENDWLLDAAIRYVATQEVGDDFNQWAPSVVLKVPLSERCNIHAEYFAIIDDGREDNRNIQYFSPGAHYLISPDFEIGVRAGWGLNQDSANMFINAGIGLRF